MVSNVPRAATGPTRPSAGSAPTPRPAGRGSSLSLQNILLVLGSALLAGAAIAFLVFSWDRMGLELRATVVGVLTAAVLAGAWLARWQGLRASAEAMAALGSILVLLDAWALRATGLVTWPGVADYLGLAALACALVLGGYGWATRLTAPLAVAAALVPASAAFLAAGRDSLTAAGVVLALGAATGLARLVLRDRVARTTLHVAAATVLAFAALCAAALVLTDPGPAVLVTGLVAAVALANAWAERGLARTVWSWLAGLGLGGAGATGAGAMLDALSPPHVLAWGMVLVPAGALAGAGVSHALSRVLLLPGAGERASWPLVHGAYAVQLVLTVPAALTTGLGLLLAGLSPTPATSAAPPVWAAFVALALLSAGSILLHRLGSVPPGRTIGLWTAVPALLALVLAAALLAGAAAAPVAVVGWLTLALGTAALATRAPLPPVRRPVRALALAALPCAGWASVAVAAGGLDPVQSSRTGRLLLGLSLAATAGVLISARAWPARADRAGHPGPTALLAAASASATFAVVVLTDAAAARTHLGTLTATLTVLGALAVATVLLGRGATASRSLRAVVLGAAPATVPGMVVAFALRGLDPDAGTGMLLLAAVVGLAGLALGVPAAFGRPAQDSDRWRVTAGAALPVLVLCAVATGLALDRTGSVRWHLVAIGLLTTLPAVAGFVLTARRRRVVLEAATIVVALVLLLPLIDDVTAVSVALLLAGLGCLAWATTPARENVVWPGCVLLVLGSWLLAASRGLDLLEAYSLPLAVVVLTISGWRARRGSDAAPTFVAGLGALTLPTALQAPLGPAWRPAATAAAVIVIVAGGILLRRRREAESDVATTPGGSAGTVATAVRRTDLVETTVWLALTLSLAGVVGRAIRVCADLAAGAEGYGVRAVVWAAVGAALTALVCWALAGARAWPADRGPGLWGPALVLATVTVPALFPLTAGVLVRGATTAVVLALVGAWGALGLLGDRPTRLRRARFGRAAPHLVVAFLLALMLGSATALPTDVVLTLAGVFTTALTVSATRVLTDRSTWETVSWGVVATVVPTSTVMLVDPAGWRVVTAVGLAAAWLLAGLLLRWQAPVGLGALALAAQLAFLVGPPALAAISGLPSSVILAFVGAVLLFAGFSYERQVKRAKTAVRRFSDLR